MSSSEFLNHPILNIVLYNNVGKKEYERIVNYFKVPKINLNDYDDITRSFDEVFESTPGTMFENALNDINDWLILECDLPEQCKNPFNKMKQDLKQMGISMK